MRFPNTLAISAASLQLVSGQTAATSKLTVDVTQKFQDIDGFGFSEAFQRAYNIYNLAEPKRSEVIDLFFNTTTGAGFSIVRNGIGSSPNSSLDWMNTHLPNGPAKPGDGPVYVWSVYPSGFFLREDWMKKADADDQGWERLGAVVGVAAGSRFLL